MSTTGVHIGRRTGCNIKAGKVIRKVDNLFDDFSDYWTESENEASLQKLPEPVKCSTRIGDATSCFKNERMLRSMSPFPSSDHSNTLTILKDKTKSANRMQDEQLLSQEQKTGSALTDEGNPKENLNVCHDKQNVEISQKNITSATVSLPKQLTTFNLLSSMDEARSATSLKLLPQGNDLGSISRIEAPIFPQKGTNSAVGIFHTKKRLTYSDGAQETTRQSLQSNETFEELILSQRNNQVSNTSHHVADEHQLLDGATEQVSVHQSKTANQKIAQQSEPLISQDTQRPESELGESCFTVLSQKCLSRTLKKCTKKKDALNSTDVKEKQQDQNQEASSKCVTTNKSENQNNHLNQSQQTAAQEAGDSSGKEHIVEDPCLSKRNEKNSVEIETECTTSADDRDADISEDFIVVLDNNSDDVHSTTAFNKDRTPKPGTQKRQPKLNPRLAAAGTKRKRRMSTKHIAVAEKEPPIDFNFDKSEDESVTRFVHQELNIIPSLSMAKPAKNMVRSEHKVHTSKQRLPKTKPTKNTNKTNSKLGDRNVLTEENNITEDASSSDGKPESERNELVRRSHKRQTCLEEQSCENDSRKETRAVSEKPSKLSKSCSREATRSNKRRGGLAQVNVQGTSSDKSEQAIFSHDGDMDLTESLDGVRSQAVVPAKDLAEEAELNVDVKACHRKGKRSISEAVRSDTANVPPVKKSKPRTRHSTKENKTTSSIKEIRTGIYSRRKQKGGKRHVLQSETNTNDKTPAVEYPAGDTRSTSQTENKAPKRKGKRHNVEECCEAVKSPVIVPANNSDLFSLDLSPIRGLSGHTAQNYIDDSNINPDSPLHKCFREGTHLENHLVTALKQRSRHESMPNSMTGQGSSSPLSYGVQKSSLRNNQSSLPSSPSLVHYCEVVKSRTKTPIQQTPDETEEKLSKIIVPKPCTNGLRRSHRTRVMPLEWYRNERIKYERRESGLVVAGIESPLFRDDGKPMTRTEKLHQLAKKRKQKSRLPKTPRNLSVHEPYFNNFTSQSTSEIPVVDPATQEEVSIECVVTKDQHNYYNLLGKPAGPDDGLAMCKTIVQSSFSLGLLILRPLEEKKTQRVRKDSMAFVIKQGKVAVTIHKTTSVLETDDSFFVPPGNTYSIKNLRRDEAKLWFYQHKG